MSLREAERPGYYLRGWLGRSFLCLEPTKSHSESGVGSQWPLLLPIALSHTPMAWWVKEDSRTERSHSATIPCPESGHQAAPVKSIASPTLLGYAGQVGILELRSSTRAARFKIRESTRPFHLRVFSVPPHQNASGIALRGGIMLQQVKQTESRALEWTCQGVSPMDA
jgi:hypothetical protein